MQAFALVIVSRHYVWVCILVGRRTATAVGDDCGAPLPCGLQSNDWRHPDLPCLAWQAAFRIRSVASPTLTTFPQRWWVSSWTRWWWNRLHHCWWIFNGMVERLDWIFVRKVAESINTNSNQKLHPKSYVLRGGGATHFARAPPSRYPFIVHGETSIFFSLPYLYTRVYCI